MGANRLPNSDSGADALPRHAEIALRRTVRRGEHLRVWRPALNTGGQQSTHLVIQEQFTSVVVLGGPRLQADYLLHKIDWLDPHFDQL